MTYFIVVSKVVGQVELLNLIRCETNKELVDRLNHKEFRDIEFVDSIMGLAFDKKAMQIRGETRIPTKRTEWVIEPLKGEDS